MSFRKEKKFRVSIYEMLEIKKIVVSIKAIHCSLLSKNDIIEFKNGTGETIQAVELKSADTVYLIKIGKKMNQIIQEFEDEQSELNEDSEFIEENKEIESNLDFDLN